MENNNLTNPTVKMMSELMAPTDSFLVKDYLERMNTVFGPFNYDVVFTEPRLTTLSTGQLLYASVCSLTVHFESGCCTRSGGYSITISKNKEQATYDVDFLSEKLTEGAFMKACDSFGIFGNSTGGCISSEIKKEAPTPMDNTRSEQYSCLMKDDSVPGNLTTVPVSNTYTSRMSSMETNPKTFVMKKVGQASDGKDQNGKFFYAIPVMLQNTNGGFSNDKILIIYKDDVDAYPQRFMQLDNLLNYPANEISTFKGLVLPVGEDGSVLENDANSRYLKLVHISIVPVPKGGGFNEP